MISNKTILLFFLCCSISWNAFADITLPDILSDNMVLQRNQSVPIWGKAEIGETVKIIFNQQTKSTIADKKGNWKISLNPMVANNTPTTLFISGNNTLELKNILIGEVWLCTGQSNMQWELQQSEGGEDAIKNAKYPHIRLFNVSREVSFKKAEGKLATWQATTPESVKTFSGVGYFFALELYKKLGIPIGMVNSSFGGSQAEAWTPREYLAASPELIPCIEREKIWAAKRPQVQKEFDQKIKEWKVAVKKSETKNEKPPRKPRVPDALRDYRLAASIYDNMIQPLIPFAIKGALWYQGESNEERAEQYELLLATMIRSWREKWGQGDFPFAIVQLPNFKASESEPTDQAWSRLRDAQRKVFLQTKNTGLIVTIDIGEGDDIHPINKLDVGKRLFRWAMADAYQSPILKSGPVFTKAKFKRKKIILYFDEVGNGLKTCDGSTLKEFVIAGKNKKWIWAKAKIIGKIK